MPLRSSTRRWAVGGVVGPGAFVGAWVVGAVASGSDYSSLVDPISRLAAVGAPTRALMTAGFVGFGLGVAGFSVALRRVLGGSSSTAAVVAAGVTVLVACAPLDHSSLVDRLHGLFAGVGYVALAAVPLLAAPRLFDRGAPRLAAAGIAASAVCATALSASLLGAPTGLFQRIGLTVADAWIIATAIAIVVGADARFESSAGRERSPRGETGARTMRSVDRSLSLDAGMVRPSSTEIERDRRHTSTFDRWQGGGGPTR